MRDHTRRKFLQYGTALVLGGATALTGTNTIARNDYDEARSTNTETTVNTLEDLGEIIERGEPAEVLYDLGKGEERTEVLMTHFGRNGKTVTRTASSPLITLSKDNGGISMDIIDSDRDANGYSYRNLRPQGAVFEQPTYKPDELGDLVINLEDLGERLVISQYSRAA